jgi:MFS family permease
MPGALAFGWLAGRIGPTWTLVVNAGLQIAGWSLLLVAQGPSQLSLAAGLLGACGGGVIAVFGALLAARFGPERFSTSMGVASFIAVPFTFGAGPLAGALSDATGSYHSTIMVSIAALVGAAGIFAWRALRDLRTGRVSVA